MKVPLSLLLCFPVISLSIALPSETSLEDVKILFRRYDPPYHYDTQRGPKVFKRPDYPGGMSLFNKRRTEDPPGFVFEINTKDRFSRKLLLTKTSSTQAVQYYGPRELSAEHLVEVSQTFGFVKKVLGDEVEQLGNTLDIRWLIIENLRYSIDSTVPTKKKKEYFEPMIHLKWAVGSTNFQDELVIMTKELNGAKAPLIQGEEVITEKVWTGLDGPKDKFEAAARIAVVAEAVLSPEIRTLTKAQMKRLTRTIATWDVLYAAWYCDYESNRAIWDPIKKRIKGELSVAKAGREKQKKDPKYPEKNKNWPEINEDLPGAPPDPNECSETFEQHWISYQNKIYDNFRVHVKTQLDKAKEKMQGEYGPSGTGLRPNDDRKTKDLKRNYLDAVSRVMLPAGWVSDPIIEPDDFVYEEVTITRDPKC